ncbi:hypothetical protein K461DRAFT_289530 [Myriangium duriaei CBS 260.36]|uniref:2EXR domain-containing protein n=1 Tax=Myriangium duriaei CBS 260.36 TaxID=1168546 RepID=A0A9P4JDV2_9PEZI|nr:hypothetical protein K461DRAFT_289530 [Myriangium duriaei CBS 260.36]
MDDQVSFPLFPRLPIELRQLIWRRCLPHRVVQLDAQLTDLTFEEDDDDDGQSGPPCGANEAIDRVNMRPPALAAVSREARAVAHEHGAPLTAAKHGAWTADVAWFSAYALEAAWADPTRDAVHLNWTPASDIEWGHYTLGDPVRSLLALAGRRARPASFTLGLLQVFQHDPRARARHPHYRWTTGELAGLLRARDEWAVVVREPYVVHSTPREAAGLFGHLSDAPVQLVDLDDRVRIERYLALNNGSEATWPPPLVLGQDSVDEARAELKSAVEAVFGSDTGRGNPRMRPAVMFRLCTRMDPNH